MMLQVPARMMVEGREEDTGRQAAPVERISLRNIEAGSTSQGTSALEAEAGGEDRDQESGGCKAQRIRQYVKNAQCRVYIRGSRGLQYLCSVPHVVSALRCAWERNAAPVRGGLPSAMQVVEPFAYMVRDGAR